MVVWLVDDLVHTAKGSLSKFSYDFILFLKFVDPLIDEALVQLCRQADNPLTFFHLVSRAGDLFLAFVDHLINRIL